MHSEDQKSADQTRKSSIIAYAGVKWGAAKFNEYKRCSQENLGQACRQGSAKTLSFSSSKFHVYPTPNDRII